MKKIQILFTLFLISSNCVWGMQEAEAKRGQKTHAELLDVMQWVTKHYPTHYTPFTLWNYGTLHDPNELNFNWMKYSFFQDGSGTVKIKIYRKISRAELNEQWRLPEEEVKNIPESVIPSKLVGEWYTDDPYVQDHFFFLTSGYCIAK